MYSKLFFVIGTTNCLVSSFVSAANFNPYISLSQKNETKPIADRAPIYHDYINYDIVQESVDPELIFGDNFDDEQTCSKFCNRAKIKDQMDNWYTKNIEIISGADKCYNGAKCVDLTANNIHSTSWMKSKEYFTVNKYDNYFVSFFISGALNKIAGNDDTVEFTFGSEEAEIIKDTVTKRAREPFVRKFYSRTLERTHTDLQFKLLVDKKYQKDVHGLILDDFEFVNCHRNYFVDTEIRKCSTCETKEIAIEGGCKKASEVLECGGKNGLERIVCKNATAMTVKNRKSSSN
eukprot:Pgem_evm1s14232